MYRHLHSFGEKCSCNHIHTYVRKIGARLIYGASKDAISNIMYDLFQFYSWGGLGIHLFHSPEMCQFRVKAVIAIPMALAVEDDSSCIIL